MKYKIGEICSINKGKVGISKAVAGGYPLVTTAEERRTHNEYHFDTKGVIIPLVSSTGHGHASLKRVHYQEGKFAVGNILCVVEPKDERLLDPQFLYIYLSYFKDQLLVPLMRGAANVSLSIKSVKTVEIVVPALQRQQEIIALFTKLEKQAANLNQEYARQNEFITQLRQSILQEAIQGKLVPQDPTDEPAAVLLDRIRTEKAALVKAKKIKKEKALPPITEEEMSFELTKGWVWCRLGDICQKVTDGFHHTPKKIARGSIYISATHIYDGRIDWDNCLYISNTEHEKLKKKTNPQKGDILITNRGAGCATPVIIDRDTEFSFQNIAIIGFNQREINSKYLFYFLLKSKSDIMDYFVNGGLQPMLSNRILRTISLPLPPLPEQYRIVTKVEQLLGLCDKLAAQVERSQADAEVLLRAVLQEAFG